MCAACRTSWPRCSAAGGGARDVCGARSKRRQSGGDHRLRDSRHLMQALDTTIANVALPYIKGSVSASQDQIDWVLTSYIAAAAIMTPPTGYLAGRFGLKRLFLVSVAGFTVASLLCGMAQSLVEIVLFRVLQGVFGAALVRSRRPCCSTSIRRSGGDQRWPCGASR